MNSSCRRERPRRPPAKASPPRQPNHCPVATSPEKEEKDKLLLPHPPTTSTLSSSSMTADPSPILLPSAANKNSLKLNEDQYVQIAYNNNTSNSSNRNKSTNRGSNSKHNSRKSDEQADKPGWIVDNMNDIKTIDKFTDDPTGKNHSPKSISSKIIFPRKNSSKKAAADTAQISQSQFIGTTTTTTANTTANESEPNDVETMSQPSDLKKSENNLSVLSSNNNTDKNKSKQPVTSKINNYNKIFDIITPKEASTMTVTGGACLSANKTSESEDLNIKSTINAVVENSNKKDTQIFTIQNNLIDHSSVIEEEEDVDLFHFFEETGSILALAQKLGL